MTWLIIQGNFIVLLTSNLSSHILKNVAGNLLLVILLMKIYHGKYTLTVLIFVFVHVFLTGFQIDDDAPCRIPYHGEPNPFCHENIDVSNFLNLHSLGNHEDFCLAYVFTYRDFTGGTLGLAWVASASGVCFIHTSSRITAVCI